MILTSEVERYTEAYKAMAAMPIPYRPGAPSDGYGNITVPLDQLDLDTEAFEWADQLSAETDSRTFWIGVPDYRLNRAFVYALEIARACCGVRPELARDLTKLLAAELDQL